MAWQEDFGNRDEKKSIILEAIANANLYIWYVFFGFLGSNNDLNVLDRLPLIHNMLIGERRNLEFKINGCRYNRYYLLTNGIYLE